MWYAYGTVQKLEQAPKKNISVLDPKRSNAINIGLTAMPQPRIIRTAILKMDNAVLNYEAIEVLPHLLFTSLIHFLSFPFVCMFSIHVLY